MTNLLRKNIFWKDVENYLLRKKREIEDEIKSLEKDDPLSADGVAEPAELGTASWQADVHYKVVAVKERLGEMSTKIQTSLKKIKDGSYGRCDRCGKEIARERLEAIPLASTCQLCNS